MEWTRENAIIAAVIGCSLLGTLCFGGIGTTDPHGQDMAGWDQTELNFVTPRDQAVLRELATDSARLNAMLVCMAAADSLTLAERNPHRFACLDSATAR